MNPGEGERSYAQNSSLQNEVQAIAKMVVQQAVLEFYLSSHGENININDNNTKRVIRIADLGCAFGPNAWKVVTDVVGAVLTKCQELELCPPEFQVFLNDLPGNDFNTVFRSIPGMFLQDRVQCYIAGVPGSFYKRLFPNRSVDFFHSSTSIHWLSRNLPNPIMRTISLEVPTELQGDYGSRLNSDNIYISQSSPRVVIDAYRMQFQTDFEKFLRCRSEEEIVANGRMVLTWMGRRNPDVVAGNYHIFWGLLAQTLNDMAAQGLVEKEKIIKFNIPFYYPSLEEVMDIVEREGSFSIKFMDVFDIDMVGCQKQKCSSDDGFDREYHSGARNIARHIRAVVESLLATLVGEDLIDDLFRRYEKNVREYCLLNEEALLFNLIVSLQREA